STPSPAMRSRRSARRSISPGVSASRDTTASSPSTPPCRARSSRRKRSTAVIPLRAFTLFSTPEALDRYLHENREQLTKTLARLDGKREWTLRVEFDAERFSDALTTRVDALRDL